MIDRATFRFGIIEGRRLYPGLPAAARMICGSVLVSMSKDGFEKKKRGENLRFVDIDMRTEDLHSKSPESETTIVPVCLRGRHVFRELCRQLRLRHHAYFKSPPNGYGQSPFPGKSILKNLLLNNPLSLH